MLRVTILKCAVINNSKKSLFTISLNILFCNKHFTVLIYIQLSATLWMIQTAVICTAIWTVQHCLFFWFKLLSPIQKLLIQLFNVCFSYLSILLLGDLIWKITYEHLSFSLNLQLSWYRNKSVTKKKSATKIHQSLSYWCLLGLTCYRYFNCPVDMNKN